VRWEWSISRATASWIALKVPKFKGEEDADQIKRFHREARSAAALHHRNICPVYDTGKIEGIRYISMSYIDGQPLDKLINPDELQPPQLVAVLVRKLALGMQKAHDAGVLHRDLKPSNIIIDNDGEPVLMDFGLAVQFGPSQQSRLTQTGTLLGTPAYMSPEQVEGDPAHIGPPADIYSLGVILYEMLTGDVPFGGSVAAVIGQIVTQQPLRPSELNPKVDRQLQSICLKAMAKQPDERYESMGDMARALSAVCGASNPTSELKPQPITSADAPIVFDAPPVNSDDEFIEGRCGSCGIINDTSRNFCKACGSALMVPCLSCEVEIGSWERFCPNCGSNVPDTLKERQSELDGLAILVRSLRDSHQFDEAIAEARKICGEGDARFSEICKWAATTIQELSVEQSEWLSRHRRAFKDAESLVSQCHYSQAVDLLEAIPIGLKQAGADALLAKAQEAVSACRILRETIDSRYKSKQLDGLLVCTGQYLELIPHDTRIQSLHMKLIDREASKAACETELRTQIVRAQHLASAGKYEAAMKLLHKSNAALDGTSTSIVELRGKANAVRKKCGPRLAKIASLKDELQSAMSRIDGIENNRTSSDH
jgi:serine/threonine protein kinase